MPKGTILPQKRHEKSSTTIINHIEIKCINILIKVYTKPINSLSSSVIKSLKLYFQEQFTAPKHLY